jgi:hypothetical protein
VSGRPDPKPERAEPIDDPEVRLEFKVAVLATDGRCVLHDDPADCEGDLQAHHVVTRQQLRHAGRRDLEWDPRNGATVCEDVAHRRHTLALERIPFSRLPRRCVAFAREYGFEDVLRRYYPPDE